MIQVQIAGRTQSECQAGIDVVMAGIEQSTAIATFTNPVLAPNGHYMSRGVIINFTSETMEITGNANPAPQPGRT